MAASALMECLTNFTRSDEPDFQSPFILNLDGAKWSVASDRVWVVAVRGAGAYLPWETSQERQQRITKLLCLSTPNDAVTVSLSEVLAWTGPITDDVVPGRFCGVMVNAGRIASLLTHLPFGKLLVWDASECAGMPAVAFSAGDRWRAVLAGLKSDYPAELDPFDPTVGRKLFDVVMGVG